MSALTLQAMLRKEDPDKVSLPFEYDLASNDISLGIEIELENLSSSWRVGNSLPSWAGVSDGSLRGNSIEIRSKGPVKGTKLKNDLNDLFLAFDATEGLARHANVRTSMHVHLNMLDCTAEMLMGTLAIGALLDDYIFNQTHENRRYTGYSCPSQEVLIDILSSMQYNKSTKYRKEALYLSNDQEISRYHSINTLALMKHGTIEFRHFATPETKEKIVELINIVMTVKLLGLDLANKLNNDFSDPELIYSTAKALIDEVYEIPEYILTSEHFVQLFMTMQSVAASSAGGLGEVDTLEGEWEALHTSLETLESNAALPDQPEASLPRYYSPTFEDTAISQSFSADVYANSPGPFQTTSGTARYQSYEEASFEHLRRSNSLETVPGPTMQQLTAIARSSRYMGLHSQNAPRITGPTANERTGVEMFRGVSVRPGELIPNVSEHIGNAINPTRTAYTPCSVISLSPTSDLFAIYNPIGITVTSANVNALWNLVNIHGVL